MRKIHLLKNIISISVSASLLIGTLPVITDIRTSDRISISNGFSSFAEGEIDNDASAAVFNKLGGFPDISDITKSRSYPGMPLFTDVYDIGDYMLWNLLQNNFTFKFKIPKSIIFPYGIDENYNGYFDSTLIDESWYLPQSYFPFYNSIDYTCSFGVSPDVTFTMTMNIDPPDYLEAELKKADEFIKNNPVPSSLDFESEKKYLKIIHDYIIDNTKYGNSKFNHTSHGQYSYCSLVEGESVCAGYAKSFMIIATKAGINAPYITGLSDSRVASSGHAWNLVYPKGGYSTKFVDTTWDDPIMYVTYPDGSVIIEDVCLYDYFYLDFSSIGSEDKLKYRTCFENIYSYLDYLNPNRPNIPDPISTDTGSETEATTTTETPPPTTATSETTTTEQTTATSSTPAEKVNISLTNILINPVYPLIENSVKPKPYITFNGNVLTENVDYTLAYKNNTSAGTAEIIIAGIGNYQGEVSKSFKILRGTKEKVSIDTVSVTAFLVGDKANATLTDNGKTLIPDFDYKIFTAKKSDGVYLILLGLNNYTGVRYIKMS